LAGKSGFPALPRPDERDHRVASEGAKEGLLVQRPGNHPEILQLHCMISIKYASDLSDTIWAVHEVVSDAATEKRIRALAAPLLEHPIRKGIEYQIKVFKMDVPNAYSFAGGHVYVSTGYLKEFPSDAALSFVLGHEIGHVDLKHCIEKMQYLVIGNEIAGDLANLAATAYLMLRSSCSKEQEFSADEFGFRAARHAGVPAEALIQCLRDLDNYQKRAEPTPGRKKSRTRNPVWIRFSARIQRPPPASRGLRCCLGKWKQPLNHRGIRALLGHVAALASVVETRKRDGISVREYLQIVLPWLNDIFGKRAAELTPMAWQ